MEVGQWVRLTYRDELLIGKLAETPHHSSMLCVLIRLGEQYLRTPFVSIIKVANTAQELIQVGDLVEFKMSGNIRLELAVKHHNKYDTLETTYAEVSLKYISKIYTPNEDKSVYTLQWSKE